MVAIMPRPQCVKSVGVLKTNRFPQNGPVSQIPQCTSPISHNATFCGRNVHMRAHFCYKMVHCVIFVWCIVGLNRFPQNRPVSQIPQCTSPISHNAPFCNRNVHICAHFCYKMVHCVIFVWCIVGLVWWVTEVLDTCNLMCFGISMKFFTSRFCPILWWLEHQYVFVCCTIPL